METKFYFSFLLIIAAGSFRLIAQPTIQWQKSLGGTSNDYAYTMHQTSDGGYILAGESYSNDLDVSGHHGSSALSDFWVVKLDNSGGIQWQKSLGGSHDDKPNA